MTESKLYHTTQIERLKLILAQKQLLPKFCLEENTIVNKRFRFAYSMVCFADVQDKDIKSTLKRFDNNSYISLSKKWAINNAICPVAYYVPNTLLSASVNILINCYNSLFINEDKPLGNSAYERNMKNALSMLLSTMKEYRGNVFDKNGKRINTNPISFYDEREWRYIPLVREGESFYLEESDFKKSIINQREIELEKKGYGLKFEWEDILSIGVPNTGSIDEIATLVSGSFCLSKSESLSKIVII